MALVSVKNLRVSFAEEKDREVIQGISFQIERGEILGIVGESGSGKSMTSLALMHLLPADACSEAEEMTFAGEDLLTYREKDWQKLRGKRISMVFQEPMTSLNPVLTIGKQVEEVLLLHEKEQYAKKKEERKQRVMEALSEAGLKNVGELFGKYPHQLSGGMRQRVMIAMAMLAKPELLIADEPTTALDASTQELILNMFEYYRKTYGTAVLFISHDLTVVNRICDRVIAMKDGKIVSEAPEAKRYYGEKKSYTEEIMSVRNLRLRYRQDSFFGAGTLHEVTEDVSFCLYKGETLGLVGESGSGKSTISKALTGLLPIEHGEIFFAAGIRRPQMVFQDPYGSLNPAKRIGWILEEPLKLHGKFTKKERKRLVIQALKEVELTEEHLDRFVSELSGGQRQRVAIALALMSRPEIVILDEPVSALDVTVQEQILRLLARLKRDYGMSYLFISHDRDVVERFCDRVIVLADGRVCEETDGTPCEGRM